MATWVRKGNTVERSEPWDKGMTALEAAQDSRDKWQAIVEIVDKLVESGSNDAPPFADGETCALCYRFYKSPDIGECDPEDDDECDACPLAWMLRSTQCIGTPYSAYLKARYVSNVDAKEAAEEFVRLLDLLIEWIKTEHYSEKNNA